MKKKFLIALATIVLTTSAAFALSSFSTQTNDTHVACQGKNCRATVGCDCSGFNAAGTIGSAQFVCKRCGHDKKYH